MKKDEKKEDIDLCKYVVLLDKETKNALLADNDKSKLSLLEIPTDESHSQFLEVAVKVPSRNVTGQYMKWADSNPKKAQEILVRGCVLTGKTRIEADDFMFNSTIALLAELIPMGQGNIKKFS